jgi:hypothetical protein
MFLKKMPDEELPFDEAVVYRGQGNYKYYNNAFRGSPADVLSTYGAIPESNEFFERQLLNSYSINRRLAEHFMVMGGNRRRVIFITEFACIIPNLFSSFFASDLLKKGNLNFCACLISNGYILRNTLIIRLLLNLI